MYAVHYKNGRKNFCLECRKIWICIFRMVMEFHLCKKKKTSLREVRVVFVLENMFELHERKWHRGNPKIYLDCFWFFIVLLVCILWGFHSNNSILVISPKKIKRKIKLHQLQILVVNNVRGFQSAFQTHCMLSVEFWIVFVVLKEKFGRWTRWRLKRLKKAKV